MINLYDKEIIFEKNVYRVIRQEKNYIFFQKNNITYKKDISFTFNNNFICAKDTSLQQCILKELNNNPQYPTEILQNSKIKKSWPPTYFVYQNETFNYESKGGYLWAPKDNYEHHLSLLDLTPNCIILHSVFREIHAISIVEEKAIDSPFPDLDNLLYDFDYHPYKFNPYFGSFYKSKYYFEKKYSKYGNKVNVKYFILPDPIPTNEIAYAIKKWGMYPDSPWGGLHGDTSGKMGYLFRLKGNIFRAYIKESSPRNKSILNHFLKYLSFSLGNNYFRTPIIEIGNTFACNVNGIELKKTIVKSLTKHVPIWTTQKDKRTDYEEETIIPNTENEISSETPLAKAVLGKHVGDEFSYKVNENLFVGKILDIF